MKLLIQLTLAGLLALPSLAQDDKDDKQGPEMPPPDFMSAAEAEGPRGLRVNEPGAYPGYTLFAPLNSKTIYMVDMQGEVVHSWETDSSPGAWLYLLDDGTLLRCGREDEDPQFRGGGIGGLIQKLAPDGTLLWNWKLAGKERQQHHDIEPLPNGNVLVITWERIKREEAAAHGRAPDEISEKGLWPDSVLEVKPLPPDGAAIVWEWRSWDHIIQDADRNAPGDGSIPDHPERIDVNGDHRDQPPMTEAERKKQEELEKRMKALGYAGGDDDEEEEERTDDGRRKAGDWMHTNGIDYHAGHDLIVLSSPRFDELWIIDHSTTTAEAATGRGGRFGRGGDLLWRSGNPRLYGLGDDDDKQLFAQHDPTFVDGEDGSLRVLVFNNGGERPGGDHSSVDELVLPFDPERGFKRAPGKPFGPTEPAWSYSDPDGFYSAFISGAQRLPNGNTLICSGAPGRLFEVTSDGEIVWDYRNTLGGEVDPPEHAGKAPPLALFRGVRLAADHPGIRRVLGK